MTALPTRMVPKPWGKSELPAGFTNAGADVIGEVWFEAPEALQSLLIKYIFTTAALSVQCHPTDIQARKKGHGSRGKEECWYVVQADPGAELMIGFKRDVTDAEMRQAAADGSIVDLLQRYPVSAGDFFYIPANTVHAIGAGVVLVEVQQNSDITYRLYDYGSGRELHLDEGVEAASGKTYPEHYRKSVPPSGAVNLVDGPFFRFDRLDGPPDEAMVARYSGPLYVIPLDEPTEIAGVTIWPGQCALAEDIRVLDVKARCLITQPLEY